MNSEYELSFSGINYNAVESSANFEKITSPSKVHTALSNQWMHATA